jgi:biotin/methionine sulfoxide reductase
MRYTAAHWGAYTFQDGGALTPMADDPAPARIGRGWESAARDAKSRILTPAVREGWLRGDHGAGRGRDGYVAVTWARAAALAAAELDRVRTTHGNGAIFAGSYGWASAGRFHHAQSQLRRFLNLAGGFVGARDTYSHAAAEVLFPHVLGMTNRAVQDDIMLFSCLDAIARGHILGGIQHRASRPWVAVETAQNPILGPPCAPGATGRGVVNMRAIRGPVS